MRGIARSLRRLGFFRAFLIVCTVIAVTDLVLPSAGYKPAGRAFGKKIVRHFSFRAFIDGKMAQPLERGFIRRSVFVNEVGAAYNELVFRMFGRTPALLKVGGANWIFLSENVNPIKGSKFRQLMNNNPSRVADFAEEIRNLGITPVIVLVPNRERIYADLAHEDGRVPASHDLLKNALINELTRRNIDIVDLTKVFAGERKKGTQLYFRDDHHWTYRGAEVAANAVAAKIKTLSAGHSGSPKSPARIEWVEGGKHSGSLIGLLRFRRGSTLDSQFHDPQPQPNFVDLSKPAGSSSRVFALTTSYGLWKFPEFLNVALGEPVASYIAAAKGSLYTPSKFLNTLATDRDFVRPQIAIWEIPEYHFQGIDLADADVPKLNRETLGELNFSVTAGANASITGPRKIRLLGRSGAFNIRTEKKISSIQIRVLANDFRSSGKIGLNTPAAERYALIEDDEGAIYNFDLNKSTNEVEFRIAMTRALNFEFEVLQATALK